LRSKGLRFSTVQSSCIQYCAGSIPRDGQRMVISALGSVTAQPGTMGLGGIFREPAISRSFLLSYVPRSCSGGPSRGFSHSSRQRSALLSSCSQWWG
jgi:hypothetical protein